MCLTCIFREKASSVLACIFREKVSRCALLVPLERKLQGVLDLYL